MVKSMSRVNDVKGHPGKIVKDDDMLGIGHVSIGVIDRTITRR